MSPSAAEIRDRARRVADAGEALRALPVHVRARAIEAAAHALLDRESALGRELRAALLASSGLRAEVIEHGLRTTLAHFTADALCALHAERSGRPVARAAVVLAGNVFSAAARPLLLALLCGTGVVAKASASDAAFPLLLQRALAAADRRAGDACACFAFPHTDTERLDALLEGAAVVSAFGADETLRALRVRLSKAVPLIEHGHGIGLAVIGADALPDSRAASELAARLALDIAAYDQRGCLSPQALFLEPGGAVAPEAFARELAAALAALEPSFPRGPLPAAAAAAQLQWRGVAAAVHELHASATSAVCYAGAAPLQLGPGYRNVTVHARADLRALRDELAALGPHLKALGIAGDRAGRTLAGIAPYTCPIGEMQTPPLGAHLDGLDPLEGFIRNASYTRSEG